MSTTELLSALTAEVPVEAPGHPVHLLVATDGTPRSDAAVALTGDLAARDELRVELVSVFEPLSAFDTELSRAMRLYDTDLAMRQELRNAVDGQRARLGLAQQPWPTHFEIGHPAHTIADAARAMGCDTIILGLGGHSLMERIFGHEMTLQVVRLADVPVLAVSPAAVGLPTVAVAALDFSWSSVRAAQRAIDLVARPGTVYLVHVADAVPVPVADASADDLYHRSIEKLFATLTDTLEIPEGVRVERVVAHGAPAKALLELAREKNADLIAAGSHGHSAVARMFVGSVSTKLVREAACSVLVVPPGPERLG